MAVVAICLSVNDHHNDTSWTQFIPLVYGEFTQKLLDSRVYSAWFCVVVVVPFDIDLRFFCSFVRQSSSSYLVSLKALIGTWQHLLCMNDDIFFICFVYYRRRSSFIIFIIVVLIQCFQLSLHVCVCVDFTNSPFFAVAVRSAINMRTMDTTKTRVCVCDCIKVHIFTFYGRTFTFGLSFVFALSSADSTIPTRTHTHARALIL